MYTLTFPRFFLPLPSNELIALLVGLALTRDMLQRINSLLLLLLLLIDVFCWVSCHGFENPVSHCCVGEGICRLGIMPLVLLICLHVENAFYMFRTYVHVHDVQVIGHLISFLFLL